MADLGLYTLFNGLTIIAIEIVFADRAIRINGNNKILAAVLYSTMYVLFPCLRSPLILGPLRWAREAR